MFRLSLFWNVWWQFPLSSEQGMETDYRISIAYNYTLKFSQNSPPAKENLLWQGVTFLMSLRAPKNSFPRAQRI